MFKKRASFYIKTLIAYGIVLTLLYCSSMQYEQKYNAGEQLDVVENCTLGVLGKVELEGQQTGYPYIRMDNLLKQCTVIELEYRSYGNNFAQNYDKVVNGVKIVDKVKLLPQKIDKIIGKLNQEHNDLVNYAASFRSRSRENTQENLCLKEHCLPTRSANDYLLKRIKQKRIVERSIWAVKRAIKIQGQMQRGSERLIEQAKLRDEAAKGRAVNAANAAASVANHQ